MISIRKIPGINNIVFLVQLYDDLPEEDTTVDWDSYKYSSETVYNCYRSLSKLIEREIPD